MPQKKSDDEFTLPALLGTFPYRQLGKRNIIETKVPFGCECVSSWEVAYNPPKRRYIIRRWYISGSLYTANWGIIYIYISPITYDGNQKQLLNKPWRNWGHEDWYCQDAAYGSQGVKFAETEGVKISSGDGTEILGGFLSGMVWDGAR